jgi:hypothetical protein
VGNHDIIILETVRIILDELIEKERLLMKFIQKYMVAYGELIPKDVISDSLHINALYIRYLDRMTHPAGKCIIPAMDTKYIDLISAHVRKMFYAFMNRIEHPFSVKWTAFKNNCRSIHL